MLHNGESGLASSGEDPRSSQPFVKRNRHHRVPRSDSRTSRKRTAVYCAGAGSASALLSGTTPASGLEQRARQGGWSAAGRCILQERTSVPRAPSEAGETQCGVFGTHSDVVGLDSGSSLGSSQTSASPSPSSLNTKWIASGSTADSPPWLILQSSRVCMAKQRRVDVVQLSVQWRGTNRRQAAGGGRRARGAGGWVGGCRCGTGACTCEPVSLILLKQMATSSGFLFTSLAIVSTTVCTESLAVGSRKIRVLFRLAIRKRFACRETANGGDNRTQ